MKKAIYLFVTIFALQMAAEARRSSGSSSSGSSGSSGSSSRNSGSSSSGSRSSSRDPSTGMGYSDRVDTSRAQQLEAAYNRGAPVGGGNTGDEYYRDSSGNWSQRPSQSSDSGGGGSWSSSCPTVVSSTVQCGSIPVTELPFTYRSPSSACSDVTETQTELPLRNTASCTYSNLNELSSSTTATCKKTVQVPCDPCAGLACPSS